MSAANVVRYCPDLSCAGITPCAMCLKVLAALISDAMFAIPNVGQLSQEQGKAFWAKWHEGLEKVAAELRKAGAGGAPAPAPSAPPTPAAPPASIPETPSPSGVRSAVCGVLPKEVLIPEVVPNASKKTAARKAAKMSDANGADHPKEIPS